MKHRLVISAHWISFWLLLQIIAFAVVRVLSCQLHTTDFSFAGCAQIPILKSGVFISLFVSLLATVFFYLLDKMGWWKKEKLIYGALLAILFLDPRAFAFSSRNTWGIFRALLVAVLIFSLFPNLRRFLKRPRSKSDYPFSLVGMGKPVAFSALFYLLCFVILTFPMILEFNTHVFADGGDGMQMVWNVWWFNKAIWDGVNPFHTSYLHYPLGSTLLGASYHPLKSLLVTPLIPFIGLMKAYNVLFISTFVACGIGAFSVAYALTRHFLGAMFAGFIFAFWNNRFAHGNGHMHVMSSEFIPFFLLSLLAYYRSPTIKWGLTMALILFASLMVDHYSFLCNFFLLAGFGFWAAYQNGELFLLGKRMRRSGGFFLSGTLLTSGTYLYLMLSSNRLDPWVGSHGPQDNSMDLGALFIPSAYSWMKSFTEFYWTRIRAGNIEGSVFTGMVVTVLAFAVFRYRLIDEKTGLRSLFCLFFGAFFVLALGPYLQVWGYVTPFSLPYLFLQKSVPPLRMSGVPVRLSVVPVLILSIVAAFAVFHLHLQRRFRLLVGLLFLTFIETIPVLPARTEVTIPPHIAYIAALPRGTAILDADSFMTTALYYQTIHTKPLAFGYIARIPQSRVDLEIEIRKRLMAKQYQTLRSEYGFKHLLVPTDFLVESPELKTLYSDVKHTIFEIHESPAPRYRIRKNNRSTPRRP